MMPKKMVKTIAIVLAALMFISILAVITQVVAVDANSLIVTPATGDNVLDYIIPIVIFIVAVIVVIACLVIPKLKKKDN